MATIYDVELEKFQEKLVEELKKIKEITMPEWAKFVKTGTNRERTPSQKDWWYLRAASILRQVYMKGPIGVNKLRLHYGGKKNRGDMPEKFYKASGKIIRTILQQLEAAGLTEKKSKGIRKGRIVTNKAKSFMDKLASSLLKGNKTEKKGIKDKKETKQDKKDGNIQKAKQEDSPGKEKPSN